MTNSFPSERSKQCPFPASVPAPCRKRAWVAVKRLWTSPQTPVLDGRTVRAAFDLSDRHPSPACVSQGAADSDRSEIEAVVLSQGLKRSLGPGAQVLDHLGGAERAELRRGAVVGTARQSDQKARREQVARSGGVDQTLDRARGNHFGRLARDDHAALLAARDHGKRRIVAQRIERGLEISGLIKAVQFALVGKDEIDPAGA